MHEIDWHALYSRKTGGNLLFNEKMLEEYRRQEAPFVELVKRHAGKGARGLDAGCGLGRMALLLSLEGYRMTALDKDARMLELAQKNVVGNGGNADFIEGDLASLPYEPDSFDFIIHPGILEHYSEQQAKEILHRHLSVAPLVIFSVPIEGERTVAYFGGDTIERNIRGISQWKRELEEFNAAEILEAKMRSTNMLAAIKRQRWQCTKNAVAQTSISPSAKQNEGMLETRQQP
ncbi:MAG: class I SAM-dependent methyltransferase [Candidatus Micrarchaeota archaeon]